MAVNLRQRTVCSRRHWSIEIYYMLAFKGRTRAHLAEAACRLEVKRGVIVKVALHGQSCVAYVV